METSSQFFSLPGLACMCVPYCCTEYASPGVSWDIHTHSKGDWKRLAAAIICLLETTGTGHHKCQQGSRWVGWQHRLALGWLSFILCLTAHLPTSASIWKVLIHLGKVKYTKFCLLKTMFFCFTLDIDISLFFISLIYQMVKEFHLDRISKIFSTQ